MRSKADASQLNLPKPKLKQKIIRKSSNSKTDMLLEQSELREMRRGEQDGER